MLNKIESSEPGTEPDLIEQHVAEVTVPDVWKSIPAQICQLILYLSNNKG